MSAPQTGNLDETLGDTVASRIVIGDVPFFPQEEYQCGPAALATLLNFKGEDVSDAALVDEVYVPGRNGSFQVELLAAARSRGLLTYELAPSLADLLREVEAGNPVLVFQNLGLSIRPQWHFAVVKGYDMGQRKLILNSGVIEDYTMDLSTFERTWARAEHWAVVMETPGGVPITANADAYFRSLSDLQHSYADAYAIQLAYEGALQRWPQDRQLLLGLGNHLLAEESLQRAADAYSRAVVYHPDYSPALNNLAHTLLLLGEAEAALGYAQQAIANSDQYRETYQNTYADIVEELQLDRN